MHKDPAEMARGQDGVGDRLTLQVLYSTVRVSELVGLRIRDIDSGRNTITVRRGKGAKDRRIPLSPTLLATSGIRKPPTNPILRRS